MTETENYNLIFKGEVAPGQEINNVKLAFAKTFKISPEKIPSYFSGKPVVLKKNVEHAVAYKYKAALERVGALSELQRIVVKPQTELAALSLTPMEDNVDGVSSSPENLPTSKDEKVSEGNAQSFRCPKCSFEQSEGNFCIQCGIFFDKYYAKIQGRESEATSPSDTIEKSGKFSNNNHVEHEVSEAENSFGIKALVAAGFAALAGALIWKMVAVAFDYELGLIAWGIGGMIGYAALRNGSSGNTAGVVCALLALISIWGGKYLAYDTLKAQMFDVMNMPEFDQSMQLAYADEKAMAKRYFESVYDETTKKQFIFNQGLTEALSPNQVSQQEIDSFDTYDLPRFTRIIQQQPTFEQWMSNEVQPEISNLSTSDIMQESFAPIDLLFLLLGMGTAFRLARNE